MKDEAFLQLSPTEARQHANFQGEPDETRLKALYLERNGVDLNQTRGTAAPAAASTETPGSALSGWALAFILLGVGLSGWAFAFDVGVDSGSAGLYGIPERVANTDRLAIRHMILASGLALFVSGWVLVGADHVAKALRRP